MRKQLGLSHRLQQLCQPLLDLCSSCQYSTYTELTEIQIKTKLSPTFFLVGYVEEKLWWPIQNPYIGRKKKAKG